MNHEWRKWSRTETIGFCLSKEDPPVVLSQFSLGCSGAALLVMGPCRLLFSVLCDCRNVIKSRTLLDH